MCVIAVLPEGTQVSREETRNMWNANSDGAGFMFVNPLTGNIAVKKFMKYAKFEESFFATYEKFKDTTPFILHFRIGTHGSKTIENVHPFTVNGNVAFCHNGILNNVPTDEHRSDTRVFNDTFMKGLPHNFTRNQAIMNMIHELIGCSYNKFVFLTREKEVVILNRSLGVESEGRWFSNHSFRSSPYRGYPGAYGWEDFDYEGYNARYSYTHDPITGGWEKKKEEEDDVENIRATKQFEEWCPLCKQYVYYKEFDYLEFGTCEECITEFTVFPRWVKRSEKIDIETIRYQQPKLQTTSWKEYLQAKEDALKDIADEHPMGVYTKYEPSIHSLTMSEWEEIRDNRLSQKLGVGL